MTPEEVARVSKARAAFRANIEKARESPKDEAIMRRTLELQAAEGSLDIAIMLASTLADWMDAADKTVSDAN